MVRVPLKPLVFLLKGGAPLKTGVMLPLICPSREASLSNVIYDNFSDDMAGP